MEKISLIKSTILEATPNSDELGLLEVFLAQLKSSYVANPILAQDELVNNSLVQTDYLDVNCVNLKSSNIFSPILVVVPNLSFANWLEDKITDELGICSNLKFVTMEQFIALHYTQNFLPATTGNKVISSKPYDFNQALYFIYDLFLNKDFYKELFINGDLDTNLHLLHEYLYGVEINTKKKPLDNFSTCYVDYARLFQLADNLTTIFHEYIYLRTEEILSGIFFKNMPSWQKLVWDKLFSSIKSSGEYTFLDVFNHYGQQLSILPNYTKLLKDGSYPLNHPKHISFEQIFVFGIYSIYPSLCKILRKISIFSEVSWYYQSVSMSYYGDLLNSFAVSKLQQKILKEPFIGVEDLYLVDGNLLVANLAQHSREFMELILANEINIIDINSSSNKTNSSNYTNTLLGLIQSDIRLIKRRVKLEYRLYPELNCYTDPITLFPETDKSLIINVCYNRMREVQVLFNQILELLHIDSNLKFSDILVTAPDIDLYAPYIKAVFDNEYTLDEIKNKITLPYLITGNRLQKDLKIIDCYQELFKIPYIITIGYLIDFISQDVIMRLFMLELRDLELIEHWIRDNHTYFGYDQADYLDMGYKDFEVYGFRQLLIKLQLGVAMTTKTIKLDDSIKQLDGALQGNGGINLPVLSVNSEHYICYDNVEATHINLITKLIKVIDLFVLVRDFVFLNSLEFKKNSLSGFIELVSQVNHLLELQGTDLDNINELIGKLTQIKLAKAINIKVFITIIDKLCKSFNTKVIFTNKITCASLQSIHNIPYPAIFMLGMNFNEFPRIHHPSKLSLLQKEWAVADRNANLEDKQLFLDTILVATKYLQLSYIGRNQQDNSSVEPSSVIKLLLDVIAESSIDQDLLLKHIIKFHPLHPFTSQNFKGNSNWSIFWHKFNYSSYPNRGLVKYEDHLFDSNETIQIDALSEEQKIQCFEINLQVLHNTFYYSNYNLYRLMGVGSNQINLSALDDVENLGLLTHEIRYNFFKQLSSIAIDSNLLVKDLHQDQIYSYVVTTGILNYGALGKYQFNLLYDLYALYLEVNNKLRVTQFTVKSDTYLGVPIVMTGDLHLDEMNNLIIQDDFTAIRDIESVYDFSTGNLYKIYVKCLLGAVINKLSKSLHLANIDNTDDASKNNFNMNNGNSNQSAKIQLEPPLVVNDVYLYLISQSRQILKYRVILSDVNTNLDIWNIIQDIYIKSLANPTVIHRNAIMNVILNYNEQDAYNKLMKIYETSYNNYELNTLATDHIMGNDVANYFKLCPTEHNTLLKITNLLQLVKLELC